MVAHHLSRMKVDSASGCDNVPGVFVRNARVQFSDKPHIHILRPVLCDLFDKCLELGQIPDLWKNARISPLHKKNDTHDLNKYRMLAVSPALYRLYANVLLDLVTDWCVNGKKIPETQFGFYPEGNTLQPMFILRHVIQAAKQKSKNKQVFCAFIYFSQAYDTVNIMDLWKHLTDSGMPDPLLKNIFDLLGIPHCGW
jgi:hypothetical protein